MKKYVRIVGLLFILMALSTMSLSAGALDTFNRDTRLAVAAKVWGFLKYYHPWATNGKTDMDQVLIESLEGVKNASTVEDFNREIREMIFRCGRLNLFVVPQTFVDVPLLHWINECPHLDNLNVFLLDQIKMYHKPGDLYYVRYYRQIGNATAYPDELTYDELGDYPAAEYRILALFRYWNVIDYFFPYKHLIPEDWDGVLLEFIPKMESAPDALSYHKTMLQVVARIRDSHGATTSDVLQNQYYGNYYNGFFCSWIEDKVVVHYVNTDEKVPGCDVRVGDVIVKIDDVPIEEIIENRKKHRSASNEWTMMREIVLRLFVGTDDTFKFTVLRDNQEYTMEAHRFHESEYSDEPQEITKRMKWRILDGNIGYINIGNLALKEVDQCMAELAGTRGIIQDCRNYTRFTMDALAPYFLPNEVEYARADCADLNYPGNFKMDEEATKIGPKATYEKLYTGKLVLIINEWTQSAIEYHTMAFQKVPNVTLVGSPSAGADGNVGHLNLPGGLNTMFSSIGIYYPDGSPTQQIGIHPDILVKPTIQGIVERNDELLEKAIEVIMEN